MIFKMFETESRYCYIRNILRSPPFFVKNKKSIKNTLDNKMHFVLKKDQGNKKQNEGKKFQN